MGTIADKLELLRRTKERQRAYLEQKYPLLDFDNIPFRAYLDLFQGRSYVPGFVLGVKAYGRSNNEDASTRDILPDYSGNGRDIKLYNFAFEGMSGYGGYPQDLRYFAINTEDVGISATYTKMTCTLVTEGSDRLMYYMPRSNYSRRKMKLKVTTSAPITKAEIKIFNKSEYTIAYIQNLTVNGETEVDVIPDEYLTDEYNENVYLEFISESTSLPIGTTVTVEELPDYPGALVSDGVDDYGQCIKDFSLPDDYTVCAIRKLLPIEGVQSGPLVAKVSDNNSDGPFLFEIYGNPATGSFSYGNLEYCDTSPELFSYLMKSNYNGTPISPGNAADSDSRKLCLFAQIESGSYLRKAALYDMRIYDHSLTAEELQTVKDEMMTDFENATGGVSLT